MSDNEKNALPMVSTVQVATLPFRLYYFGAHPCRLTRFQGTKSPVTTRVPSCWPTRLASLAASYASQDLHSVRDLPGFPEPGASEAQPRSA